MQAPIAGQIIKIHTRVGEKISTSGIANLAQTDQMMAVAEVYQTDIVISYLRFSSWIHPFLLNTGLFC
ncbi:hypothetical protein [Nostoc sp.]|uniref:hypothetical protein n=1 Tax=Nostoc sp. TaxID=1180 RepID=UPI002FFB2B89